MPKYELNLNIKNKDDNTNHKIEYSVNLTQIQEDYAHTVLVDSYDTLRNKIQKEAGCFLNQIMFNKVMKSWGQDISEGYRLTVLSIELSAFAVGQLERLNESGNQEFPGLPELGAAVFSPQLGALPPLP